MYKRFGFKPFLLKLGFFCWAQTIATFTRFLPVARHFRYGKRLVSVLDGMNSVPATQGRVLGWMRLPPPFWRNPAHSLSSRTIQILAVMKGRSKLQFEQPNLFRICTRTSPVV